MLHRLHRFFALAAALCLITAQAEEFRVSNSEIPYFNSLSSEAAERIDAVARLSGDGKKIVYIEPANGFDLSLSGWLGSCDQGWNDSNAAKVYLFDIASNARSLVYQGEFSTVVVNGQTCLQSIEAGFSAEINHDGSKIALVYSRMTFNGDRSQLSNTLNVVTVNPQTKAVSAITQFISPGFQPTTTPLHMSANGSMLVLAYEPASDTKNSIWGVDAYTSSDLRKLVAIPLRDSSIAVVLNHPADAKNGTSEELVRFIDAQHRWFFDVSDDGKVVVFQIQGNGKIVGVASDGSNYHQITQLPPTAAYISLSGDGQVVAYASRPSLEAVSLYTDSFAGGAQKLVLQGSNAHAAGNLILNRDGSALLFNTYVAGPGSGYGWTSNSYYLPTDGSQTVTALNYELEDTSDDFATVLTGMYAAPHLHISQLSMARQAEFDFATGLLTIPVVALTSTVFGDLNIAYALQLRMTPDVHFRLVSAQPVPYDAASIRASYVMESGVLELPAVTVGDTRYAATLRAKDFTQRLLELVSIQ